MLKVRVADESDSKDIFEWRNDLATRHMSHTRDLVDWQEHSRWFESTLRNECSCLLICTIMKSGEKVAVVRFDIDDTVALISINLAPSMRGKGMSKACIDQSIAYLNSVHTMISVIEAEIMSRNVASRKAFENAGFTFDRELDDVSFYRLPVGLVKPETI